MKIALTLIQKGPSPLSSPIISWPAFEKKERKEKNVKKREEKEKKEKKEKEKEEGEEKGGILKAF